VKPFTHVPNIEITASTLSALHSVVNKLFCKTVLYIRHITQTSSSISLGKHKCHTHLPI